MNARSVIAALAFLLFFPVALGCGEPSSQASAVDTGASAQEPGPTLRVVATVSPITSIVENIGGARIDLQGIIPEGVNSHTYEPAPSVAALVSRADLIVANGLFLEEPTINLAEANRRPGSMILLLGDRTIMRDEWRFDFSFPESGGHPNPHLWPDPQLALHYARLVRDALAELDPDGAEVFEANYKAFGDRIASLDEAIRTAVETLPEANRRLLTYHDSWAYFAARYGLQVVGAAEPSDFSEPNAREVADLIDQLRELQLPVIFGSEVFPSQVLEQVAAETGAAYVDDLRDDDLPGGPGDPSHSYLGLMVQNMRTMIPALGGSAASFDAVDTSPVFPGVSTARYPQ